MINKNLKCPRCWSSTVHPSASGDSQFYRLVFLVRMRCHKCSHRFFARRWW